MTDFTWLALFVGLNALIVTMLALFVSYRRITLKVANGDGGKLEMKQAIRAHMNGVEHVSIFALVVITLALLEVSSTLQATVVIMFTLGRILHALGVLTSGFQMRRLAAALTYLAEVMGIVVLLQAALLG